MQSYYLPTDETAIPYGPKEKVEGTPMDFRTPHEVGERIDEDFEALNFGKGYDHTYILNKKERERAVTLRPLHIAQNRHRNGMLHDTTGCAIIHR